MTVPFRVPPGPTAVLSSVSGDEITNPPETTIVQVKVAGVDTLPAGSVAVSERVWLPAARFE